MFLLLMLLFVVSVLSAFFALYKALDPSLAFLQLVSKYFCTIQLLLLSDTFPFTVFHVAEHGDSEVIVPFKVERINEVLEALCSSIDDEKIKPFLRLGCVSKII